MNLPQKALITLAIAVAAAAIYEGGQASTLRKKNEALQEMQGVLLDQVQQLTLEAQNRNALSKQPAVAQPPFEGSEGFSELLRLRGQVALLRNQLREQTASEAPEKNPNTKPLTSAAFCVRVPAGETLVSGGWISEPGRRLILISTPDSPDDGSINIESSLVEVSEIAWRQLGFDSLRPAPGQDIRNIVATSDVPKLFQGVKDDFNIVSAPRISTSDGRGATVSVQLPSATRDRESSNGGRFLTIGVAPRHRQSTTGPGSFDLVMHVRVLGPNLAAAANSPLPPKAP